LLEELDEESGVVLLLPLLLLPGEVLAPLLLLPGEVLAPLLLPLVP
jgi:hypothetical protein